MTAALISAAGRGPEYWIEDMTWHRQMFRGSYYRWVPEDAFALALRWVRGTCVFETPAGLRVIDTARWDMGRPHGALFSAMASRLRRVRTELHPSQWHEALELVALTGYEPRLMLQELDPVPASANADVARAVRGWPSRNPLSELWELKQFNSLWRAADDVLGDTFADLVIELAPRYGWEHLTTMVRACSTPRALQFMVECQRKDRGEPGDPRRQPEQRYDTTVI